MKNGYKTALSDASGSVSCGALLQSKGLMKCLQTYLIPREENVYEKNEKDDFNFFATTRKCFLPNYIGSYTRRKKPALRIANSCDNHN